MIICRLSLYVALLCLVACEHGGDGDGINEDNRDAPLSILFPPPEQTFLVKGSMQSEDEGISLRLSASDNIAVSAIKVNGTIQDLAVNDLLTEFFAPLDPGSNALIVSAVDSSGNVSTTAAYFINEGLFGGSQTGNVMFDAAGNRLLIIESDTIFEVNLSTNYRHILRNPDGDPLLAAGIGAYKQSGNQIYYITSGKTLRQLNLDTGVDQVISSLGSTTTGSGPTLDTVTDIVYGPATDMIYVLGHDALEVAAEMNVIISVDLSNGNRTIVTGSGVGTGNIFYSVGAIAWDSTANRLLAAATNSRLFAINVSNGNRTMISQYDPVLIGDGESYGLISSSSLAYDSAGNRAVFVAMMTVGTEMSYSLFSVDLSNGDRTVISNMRQQGAGPGFYEHGVRGLVVNPVSQKAYAVVPNLYSSLEIDLTTGNRRALSSDIGDGPKLLRPQHGRFDLAGRRLLVADRLMPALVSVNIDNGDRSVISGEAAGSGVDFDAPMAVDINAVRTIAYVLDAGLDCVFAVDLSTGNRSVISGNGAGSGPALHLFFDHDPSEPALPDMVFDEINQRLLITDMEGDAIVAVNVLTGARSIAASDLAVNDEALGLSFEIDRPGNRVFIAVLDAVSNVMRARIMEMNLATDAVQELVPLTDGDKAIYFHDLALGSDGSTLYALNNHEPRQIYAVDLVARQLISQQAFLEHQFSNQVTTIETGLLDKTVYMFDELSGAVMLMQIDPVDGSAGAAMFNYEGVILSQ